MRRKGIFVTMAACCSLAAPAPARAQSASVKIEKVEVKGYVPYVTFAATATSPCAAAADCRWVASLRIVHASRTCADATETPWAGPTENGGQAKSYKATYTTSTGGRTERACLYARDTTENTDSLLAETTYDVPESSGTVTPPPREEPAGSAPAAAPPRRRARRTQDHDRRS